MLLQTPCIGRSQLFRLGGLRFLRIRSLSSDKSSGYDTFKPLPVLMLPPGTFKSRTAFITGGGTGLGRSVAEALASLGANIFLVSRRNDVLERTCDALKRSTNNEGVAYAVADIRDNEAVKGALNTCCLRFGLPNLVVNNATGNFLCPSERLSANAFSSVVDIVLKGTAHVTLETAKALIRAQQSGTFLFVSTVYARTGSAFVMPSAAAKAGVEALVKSLAAEWGKYRLRLNAIAPGPIYTEGAFSRLDPTGQFSKELAKRIPAGRMGLPEEFVNLATYLLSDYSSWMNGEIVRFDGGEVPAISGEFNVLTRLLKDADWDSIEALTKRTAKTT